MTDCWQPQEARAHIFGQRHLFGNWVSDRAGDHSIRRNYQRARANRSEDGRRLLAQQRQLGFVSCVEFQRGSMRGQPDQRQCIWMNGSRRTAQINNADMFTAYGVLYRSCGARPERMRLYKVFASMYLNGFSQYQSRPDRVGSDVWFRPMRSADKTKAIGKPRYTRASIPPKYLAAAVGNDDRLLTAVTCRPQPVTKQWQQVR